MPWLVACFIGDLPPMDYLTRGDQPCVQRGCPGREGPVKIRTCRYSERARTSASWALIDGYMRTGRDVLRDEAGPSRWPLDRPPLPLETSVPGAFAAGLARAAGARVAGW
jgi:hypothetical protein